MGPFWANEKISFKLPAAGLNSEAQTKQQKQPHNRSQDDQR